MADRLQQLLNLLDAEPRDPFLLYGVAMEHKKAGDDAAALDYLGRTIAADAGYCYAYYQKGQVLEAAGEEVAAREAYRAGIDAAERVGDAHAKSELSAALDML